MRIIPGPTATHATTHRASGRLPRRAAGGWLWRLQGAGRARRGPPRLLLVACAPPLLRARPGRPGADRVGGARPYRGALQDRGRDPRALGRRATGGAPGA